MWVLLEGLWQSIIAFPGVVAPYLRMQQNQCMYWLIEKYGTYMKMEKLTCTRGYMDFHLLNRCSKEGQYVMKQGEKVLPNKHRRQM